MAASVRLSEASRTVIEALTSFDCVALEDLQHRLEAVVHGELELEQEPLAAIDNNQKILAGVLMATEQNLTILRRLRERRAGNTWAL